MAAWDSELAATEALCERLLREENERLGAGCGSSPFPRQTAGFGWRGDTLAPDRSVRLFDCSGGLVLRAAHRPLPRLVGAER